MSARPIVLCKLKKGQLIDSQENFVDTFNWMVDFINNLRGANGIEVKNPLTDFPIIQPSAAPGNPGEEVVTQVEYDEATHTFTQYKRKLASSVKFADKEATPSTVFTATPISA